MIMIKMQKLVTQNKTKFCDFVGYSQETKILELLLEGREMEYTLTDIVNALKINKKRAFEILHYYEKIGIIKKTKKIKHIQFYHLNKENEKVKMMTKLFDNVIEQ